VKRRLPGTSLTLAASLNAEPIAASLIILFFSFIRVRPSLVATLTARSVNVIAAAMMPPAVAAIAPGLVPAGACGEARRLRSQANCDPDKSTMTLAPEKLSICSYVAII
jgi:hypothetical protein